MKMCEYVNNLFDMVTLLFVTEKNNDIAYDGIDIWTTRLLYVNSDQKFSMVFPQKYIDFNYIEFFEKYITIIFEKAKKIDLKFEIHYR
jgi:hypothetical protein